MVQLPETLAITTFSLRLDLRSLKKSTFFLSPISTGEPIIAAPPKKWSLHLFQPCHKAGLSDVYKMDFNHVTKNLCIPIIGLFFEARQIDPKNNGQHQEALQPSPSATSKKFHRILGVDAQPKCWICICMHIYMSTCLYTYTYTYIYTYTFTYTYIYILTLVTTTPVVGLALFEWSSAFNLGFWSHLSRPAAGVSGFSFHDCDP